MTNLQVMNRSAYLDKIFSEYFWWLLNSVFINGIVFLCCACGKTLFVRYRRRKIMARIKVLYGVILMQIMIACTCHGLLSIRLTRVHKYIPIFTRKPLTKEPPTTLPPGKPLVISPVKNSSYCNESEIIAAISEDGRKKRSVSQQRPYDCIALSKTVA